MKRKRGWVFVTTGLLRFLHLMKHPPGYFNTENEDSEKMVTEVELRRGMRGF